MTQNATLWEISSPDETVISSRLAVGAAELSLDPDTVHRFLAKCASLDDRGHRWWLGAIDGRANKSGGYRRFQAGFGCTTSIITTVHRYAWTLAHGPVPPGLVVRHRCDERLCTAEAHLLCGTFADNAWGRVVRPYRAADLDTRGSAGRSRAIRDSVLRVLASGVKDPKAIGAAAYPKVCA
jgi:hypothetical protein